VLDDRDLVAALEQSAWSIFSRFGRGEGASVIDTPTRLVLETPVPQAPYNSVLRFYNERNRPLDMQVGELLDRFVGREVVMLWLVHPSAPEGLTDSLRAAGLICAEELFGMAVELTAAYTISDPGPDVRISEASPRDPTKWLEIVTERYGVGEQSISFLGDLYTKVAGDDTRVWVAEVDGAPASKVVLHVADEVAGIYGVATTEAGRNRGLATALMASALNAAIEQGCRLSVLHSTPVARGLYRRLGYDDVATFQVWGKPDQVHL